MKELFIVAGEASGDLHAASLLTALQGKVGFRVFGLGGELMRAQGVELLYDVRQLAVAGFWEVAKRILHFRRVFRSTLARVDERRPDVAILVDYPGFNLRLAKELRRRGIPVVYFIVPQVWAWKPRRIKTIEENVNLLISILPFEKQLFDPKRVRCEFVGHPLLDQIPESTQRGDFRRKHSIGSDAPLVALLPGSRMTEVSAHYPVMLAAVRSLKQRWPDLAVATARRTELDQVWYDDPERRLELQPIAVASERYELMRAADVAIVSSGTATLEMALCGQPFCVVYRTGWLTYQIARRVIKLSNVGLVNIVAGKKIVPEFLQHDMTAAKITEFCGEVISNRELAEHIKGDLAKLRLRLGSPGAGERAAQLIASGFLQ